MTSLYGFYPHQLFQNTNIVYNLQFYYMMVKVILHIVKQKI